MRSKKQHQPARPVAEVSDRVDRPANKPAPKSPTLLSAYDVQNPPDMETLKQSLLETSKLSKVSYREMEAAAFQGAFQDSRLDIKDNVSALAKKVK